MNKRIKFILQTVNNYKINIFNSRRMLFRLRCKIAVKIIQKLSKIAKMKLTKLQRNQLNQTAQINRTGMSKFLIPAILILNKNPVNSLYSLRRSRVSQRIIPKEIFKLALYHRHPPINFLNSNRKLKKKSNREITWKQRI